MTRKVTGKMAKNNDKLFKHFEGEYVRVTTSITINKLVTDQATGEPISVIPENVAYDGFLSDYDDTFIYLGKDPGNISVSILKTTVQTVENIEIEDEKTMEDLIYSTILDSMPDRKKGDYN